ncbi:hypothetical protein H8E88_09300 [candidate division KSB1 bacterium]|nr:hypothetical protein [candidate division KSB1 bacterium]
MWVSESNSPPHHHTQPLSTEALKRKNKAGKKEKGKKHYYKKQICGSVINWRVGLSLLG